MDESKILYSKHGDVHFLRFCGDIFYPAASG